MLYKRGNLAHRVTGNDLKQLYDQQHEAMRLTREKAEAADKLLHAENPIQIHKNLAALGITRPTRLPTPRTATQRILQVLTEKPPRIRRFWTGLSRRRRRWRPRSSSPSTR